MKDFKLDENAKHDPGFRIPDSYFETLPDAVFARLEQPEPKVFRLDRRWYAVAAILVAALLIPMVLRREATPEPDGAAIENYLYAQAAISQYDLVNLLDERDIEQLDSEMPVEDQAIEEILSENANLEHYIIE